MRECCSYWKHRIIRKVEGGKLISKLVNFCPECGEDLKHSFTEIKQYSKEEELRMIANEPS